jgi:hypothetical protein
MSRVNSNCFEKKPGVRSGIFAFLAKKCLVWKGKLGYNCGRKGIRKMADLKMDGGQKE